MGIALRYGAVVIALLAGVLLAGCGGDDRANGAPITLRIGTDDVRGKPAGRQIEEFARRAETLSNGRLRIRPVWHAAGDGPTGTSGWRGWS